MTQWREFLPILTMIEKGAAEKPFPYTVGQTVKQLPPKRTGPAHTNLHLVKNADLPAAHLKEDKTTRAILDKKDDEDSDDGDHVLTRKELKHRIQASLARKAKRKKDAKAKGSPKKKAPPKKKSKPPKPTRDTTRESSPSAKKAAAEK